VANGQHSHIFQAYKVQDLILENFLLFVPKRREDARFKIPFSLEQMFLQKKAAHLGIAPEVYSLNIPSCEAYLMQKIEGDSLESFFTANQDLSLKMRHDLSIKILERILLLHHGLNISHQDIQPSNILLEEGLDQTLTPRFCGFSLATTSETLKSPLGEDLYQPIEWEYDSSLTDLEKQVHPLDTREKDLYQLGLTLYFIYKGEHFKEAFDRYLNLKSIGQSWNARMSDVGCLDDFSCVRDDFCRDFLDFKLHDYPFEIRAAIRGLLRTICGERIPLESALHLLKSTTIKT
jgi:serine/threonine protein kinase